MNIAMFRTWWCSPAEWVSGSSFMTWLEIPAVSSLIFLPRNHHRQFGDFQASRVWWHLRVKPWISHDSPMNIPWLFKIVSFSGWWFGTFFIFPYIGNFIIPTVQLINIFQRGRNHQPVIMHHNNPLQWVNFFYILSYFLFCCNGKIRVLTNFLTSSKILFLLTGI